MHRGAGTSACDAVGKTHQHQCWVTMPTYHRNSVVIAEDMDIGATSARLMEGQIGTDSAEPNSGWVPDI